MMIKSMNFLRRRPGMPVAEFHCYWIERHAPLVSSLKDVLRIRRYVQSHATDGPGNGVYAARGNAASPYDGVAELWWDSVDDLMAIGATKEGRDAARLLLEDEHRFIDVSNSPAFIVREHEIINDAR